MQSRSAGASRRKIEFLSSEDLGDEANILTAGISKGLLLAERNPFVVAASAQSAKIKLRHIGCKNSSPESPAKYQRHLYALDEHEITIPEIPSLCG